MKQLQIAEVMSWMGKRSYSARVERFGIERIREIARKNGKKGGRPRKEQKDNQSLERAVPVLLTPTRR